MFGQPQLLSNCSHTITLQKGFEICKKKTKIYLLGALLKCKFLENSRYYLDHKNIIHKNNVTPQQIIEKQNIYIAERLSFGMISIATPVSFLIINYN